MALMKINTKVIFEWSSSLGRYEEVYCESYNYHGPIDKCQEEEEWIEAIPIRRGENAAVASQIDVSALAETEENQEARVTAAAFPNAAPMPQADKELPPLHAGLKEAPMHLRETINEEVESGAQLFVQNKVTGSVKAQTAKFYLTAMSIPASEKTQLLETFGSSIVSFFGANAKVYNFGGTCIDWASSSEGDPARYFHQSSLIKLYNDLMRGTRLVENGNIAILKILNHTVYGYPLNLQVQYQAQLDKMANFTMSWLVSEHTLDMHGIVTEDDLTAMHTFGSTMRVDIKTYMVQLNDVINPLFSLLEFNSYTDTMGLFSSISSLAWHSISAPDLINFFPDGDSQQIFRDAVSEKVGVVADALKASVAVGEFPALLNSQFLSKGQSDLEAAIDEWAVSYKAALQTFWDDEGKFSYSSYESVKLQVNKAYNILKTLLKWRLRQRTIAAGVAVDD